MEEYTGDYLIFRGWSQMGCVYVCGEWTLCCMPQLILIVNLKILYNMCNGRLATADSYYLSYLNHLELFARNRVQPKLFAESQIEFPTAVE